VSFTGGAGRKHRQSARKVKNDDLGEVHGEWAMTGKTLTRVDLYEAVYRKIGLPRSESVALVELVL